MHRLNIKGELIYYREAVGNLSKSDEEVIVERYTYCSVILLILY